MSVTYPGFAGQTQNAVNNAANMISTLGSVAQSNSAASAEQASIQRDWQEVQNARAMAFNHNEAALNRNWQELMSNTAHQREVSDLQSAGLNPVLSAMNGNGAAVTSGATASGVTSAGAKGEVDTSFNSALVNLLGSMLSATQAIESANINARVNEAVADKYNAMSEIVANINASASRYASDKHLQGTVYSADRGYQSSLASAGAILGAAGINASATRYASDNSLQGTQYAAQTKYMTAAEQRLHEAALKASYGNGNLSSYFGMALSQIFSSLYGSSWYNYNKYNSGK